MKYTSEVNSHIVDPDLSVVILTYNSGAELELSLSSLVGQSYDMTKIQIVVVDDGSEDNTQFVVNRFMHALSIDYYKLEHTGVRGENRNFGVSKALSERLLLLDGDMILTRNFISNHLENIEHDEFCISLGRRMRPFQTDNSKITKDVIQKYFTVLSDLPALDDERLAFNKTLNSSGIAPDDVFCMLFSHNICLWKKLFLRVGGFNSVFSKYWGAEDVEFGYRLVKNGGKIKLDDRIIGYHLLSKDDVQKKIRQLRKNLKIFRDLYDDVEVELASIEHRIWPMRYLKLREKVRNGEHQIVLKQLVIPSAGKVAAFGMKIINPLPDCVKSFGIENSGSSSSTLGLFVDELEEKYEVAYISENYRKLGEGIFDEVLRSALRKAKKVFEVKSLGENEAVYIPLVETNKKKLIITVSDISFSGNNKAYLYRLGLALAKEDVEIGFSLAGDTFGEKPKFSSFGDLDEPKEMNDVCKLYSHGLDISNDVYNLMDGIGGGGVGKSVDKRIYWQESFTEPELDSLKNDISAFYNKVILRRSQDIRLADNYLDVIPIGICKEQIESLASTPRPPRNEVVAIWICESLDYLSGIEDVFHAFSEIKKSFPSLQLKVILGRTSIPPRSDYFNDPAWKMVLRMNELQISKENKILEDALSKISDKSDISIYTGKFGDGFIAERLYSADILIDTSPNHLIRSWVLNAFAMNKVIVRCCDSVYEDYRYQSPVFQFLCNHHTGTYGSLQYEYLSHGLLGNSRYQIYKTIDYASFKDKFFQAVSMVANTPGGTEVNHSFVDEYDWSRIAKAFMAHI